VLVWANESDLKDWTTLRHCYADSGLRFPQRVVDNSTLVFIEKRSHFINSQLEKPNGSFATHLKSLAASPQRSGLRVTPSGSHVTSDEVPEAVLAAVQDAAVDRENPSEAKREN